MIGVIVKHVISVVAAILGLILFVVGLFKGFDSSMWWIGILVGIGGVSLFTYNVVSTLRQPQRMFNDMDKFMDRLEEDTTVINHRRPTGGWIRKNGNDD